MNDHSAMMEEVYSRLYTSALSKLDDQALLLVFHQNIWRRLQWDDRLQALQEVENRRAKADGRAPAKVCIAQMPANAMGGHSVLPDGTKRIVINARFVEQGKLFGKLGGTLVFNAAGALSAVLHEGRHAFQCDVVRHGIANLSGRRKLEWAATMLSENGLYNSGDSVFYYLQSIEMDARRFARRSIAQVHRMFVSMGVPDQSFRNQTIKDVQTELLIIRSVRRNLNHTLVNQYERLVLEYFKKLHPELDIRNLRLFDHVRFILDHPEINDPKEMLDRLDTLADEKLGLKEGRLLNRLENAALNGLKN